MRRTCKMCVEWLKKSNRWKHLAGGIIVGAGANDVYCAAYAGVGIAGALEFKDHQWGGKPDWIDFTCTIVGVAIGYGARVLIKTILN